MPQRNPWERGPSTSQNIADLFAGLQGLGQGLEQLHRKKREKVTTKTEILMKLLDKNTSPEERQAVLDAYSDDELKELGIPRNLVRKLAPQEELERTTAETGLRLAPLTEQATEQQLRQGIEQGQLTTERLQQLVKAGKIDLENAETKKAFKKNPNRILAMALGEDRPFGEAVQLAMAESDPEGAMKEARTALETSPEGINRKRGEYYTLLTTNPNIAMKSSTALDLADKLAKGDFSAIEKIPDAKLRTAAQVQLADQLERTRLQRMEMQQVQDRVIGSTAMSLVEKFNISTDSARRLAEAAMTGKNPKGFDKAQLAFAQERINMAQGLEVYKKQQEILKDDNTVKLLQGLYTDLLSKARVKGQEVDQATLDKVEQQYISEVAKRTGMDFATAESSGFWKETILGIGRLAGGIAEDAGRGGEVPAPDSARRFSEDLLGPEITRFIDQVVVGGAKEAGSVLAEGAGIAGKLLTLPSPSLSYLAFGEEGHPWIDQVEARLPGFRVLLRDRLDKAISEMGTLDPAAMTQAQRDELLQKLDYYESLRKKTGR